MELDKYIRNCYRVLPALSRISRPWEITGSATELVCRLVEDLNPDDFRISSGVGVHRTANIESGVTIKGYAVIGKDCFVGAGAYLRGGVYLSEGVSVGPGCEIKASFIFGRSRIAHLNFIADSLVGEDVNFEAGSVIANFFNEAERDIELLIDGRIVRTGVRKFGAIVGDRCRIGANAVLDPGSVLPPGRIVRRLEHYDQFRRPG